MLEATVPRAGRREWIGLAVLILPTLLLAIDITVLHLAVPALTRELAPSSAQLLWIVDIYGFLIAGSLITMGTLGDRIGRRKLLLAGAAAFGLASVLAAFSTSAEMLIASRALLGIAGATLMPSTMSLIRTMFADSRQRAAAIGIWVSGFSAGSAIGPLLGGLLLERYWWGSVFLVNVPVMVALLALGPFLLPEARDPAPGRFDLLSAGQSLAAVLLVIFGLKRIAEAGIGVVPVVTIAAGLAIGVLFVYRQRVLADPLVDLRLFSNRVFSVALTTNTLAFFFQFGFFLFTAQYLQLVLGLSPLEAGLWTLPSAVMFIVGSNLAPRLVSRVRPVTVITAGLVATAVAFAILTQIGLASLGLIVAASTVMAIGLSFVITPTTDMILEAAPPERAGAAAAISETGLELGGALGIAILGSIGAAIYRGAMTGNLPADIPADATATAQDTLGGAVAVAARLSDDLSAALLGTAREGFVQGLQVIAIISAVAMVGLAILVSVAMRRTAPETDPVALSDAEDRDQAAEWPYAA